MSERSTKRENGFSLLEMVVAMALGTMVLGAAVQIYSQGVAATWTVTQRAEMQQDFRAASGILTKDLSLAGAGLGQGASIALPDATSPKYGCSQSPSKCYINGGSVAFPTPTLYGLIPGYQQGPTLNTVQGPTDIITVAYTDNNFYLDCYTATVTNATTVTFTLPGATSANCTSPTGNAGAQAVNNSAVGLTPGDLVWFTFGTTNVVAEVTTAATAGGVVAFAAGDALNLNQAAGVVNSLASEYVASPPAASLTTGYGQRLLLITYYIDKAVNPPRLMQIVGGHIPVPVAENIVYLQFSYDLYSDITNAPAVGCTNPGAATDGCAGASSGMIPNQITKINIMNMAMDSSLMGSQYGQGNGYQRLDLQTSVSARNLTYTNNYPLTSP
jgi:prepilin-type N-terminal cleavage/methylation domain-containing protein